jgi:hypothetical protein
MTKKPQTSKDAADKVVKNIRRKTRQATSPEVKDLRSEVVALKECVADLTLENPLLKKSMTGAGEFEE